MCHTDTTWAQRSGGSSLLLSPLRLERAPEDESLRKSQPLDP